MEPFFDVIEHVVTSIESQLVVRILLLVSGIISVVGLAVKGANFIGTHAGKLELPESIKRPSDRASRSGTGAIRQMFVVFPFMLGVIFSAFVLLVSLLFILFFVLAYFGIGLDYDLVLIYFAWIYSIISTALFCLVTLKRIPINIDKYVDNEAVVLLTCTAPVAALIGFLSWGKEGLLLFFAPHVFLEVFSFSGRQLYSFST